jgi:hypothetical protein
LRIKLRFPSLPPLSASITGARFCARNKANGALAGLGEEKAYLRNEIREVSRFTKRTQWKGRFEELGLFFQV